MGMAGLHMLSDIPEPAHPPLGVESEVETGILQSPLTSRLSLDLVSSLTFCQFDVFSPDSRNVAMDSLF